MSTNPPNTYNSPTNISLGYVPDVDDPEIYRALLDIHNAIAALITSSDQGGVAFLAYMAKLRSVRRVTFADTPVTVLPTDGLVEVDATDGNVDVYLYAVENYTGYEVHVKRIDETSNIVTVYPEGTDTIETYASDTLDPLDSYHLKASDTGWDVI